MDRRLIASLRGAGAIQVRLRSGDPVAGPLEPLTSAVNRGLSAVEQVWGLTENTRALVQPGVPLHENRFGLVLPLLAVVGALVSLVRRGIASVGHAVALVGGAVACIRGAVALVPDAVAPSRDPLASIKLAAAPGGDRSNGLVRGRPSLQNGSLSVPTLLRSIASTALLLLGQTALR
jgi:hypothetical protein